MTNADPRPGPQAEDKAAETPSGAAPKSDPRVSGMVATVALILMFALTGLVIWLA